MARLTTRILVGLADLLAVAALSTAFALRVTPAQSVDALGQTVDVGTATPTLSLSGPGVLDLFGQSLPTSATFTGPVRPRLALTNITINQQVANFLTPARRPSEESVLGRTLADARDPAARQLADRARRRRSPTASCGPLRLEKGLTAPAQLAEEKRARGVNAIFVSVGAHDVRWDVMVELRAVSKTCDSAASTVYSQSNLNQFTKNYYELLARWRRCAAIPRWWSTSTTTRSDRTCVVSATWASRRTRSRCSCSGSTR